MSIIISPIRRLAKSIFDLTGKIVSGGLVWFGLKKLSDKLEELEEEVFKEETPQETTTKRKNKSEHCDDRR